MKFPSIFRTAQPMRFDVKPRYYDPVKEEIEQRTAKIKRELQAEGKLPMEDEDEETLTRDYGSGIRGAFAAGGQIKGRQTSSVSSAGLIRLVIFVLLIGSVFGYIYLGPEAIYTMVYVVGGIALLVLFFRLKASKSK